MKSLRTLLSLGVLLIFYNQVIGQTANEYEEYDKLVDEFVNNFSAVANNNTGGLFGQWQNFVNQIYPDPDAASTAAPATKQVEGTKQLSPRLNPKKTANHGIQKRIGYNIKKRTHHGVQKRNTHNQQLNKKRNLASQPQEEEIIIVYANVPDGSIGGRVDSKGGKTEVPAFLKFLDYLNQDIPTVEVI